MLRGPSALRCRAARWRIVCRAVPSAKLPRWAGRSARDCRDEPGAAEEDQEREDRNAGNGVRSGHEAKAPAIDEQARAEHDDACPEPTLSERRDRHRGESTPERDG